MIALGQRERRARQRTQLFEVEDQPWCPRSLRDGVTDYLRYQWQVSGIAQPISEQLANLLSRTGSAEVLDLASGGSGPVLAIADHLWRSGRGVQVMLTDRFPNRGAFAYVQMRSQGRVGFVAEPVDATAVPTRLPGVRTMFAALHHFPPQAVRRILADAVRQQRGIALFDYPAPPALPPPRVLLLGTLPGLLLAMPFVQPFRWSRLGWTYLLPLLPIVFAWDALVSGLRLYSTRELKGIVEGLPANDYTWEVGQAPFPRSYTYVIGYPPVEGPPHSPATDQPRRETPEPYPA